MPSRSTTCSSSRRPRRGPAGRPYATSATSSEATCTTRRPPTPLRADPRGREQRPEDRSEPSRWRRTDVEVLTDERKPGGDAPAARVSRWCWRAPWSSSRRTGQLPRRATARPSPPAAAEEQYDGTASGSKRPSQWLQSIFLDHFTPPPHRVFLGRLDPARSCWTRRSSDGWGPTPRLAERGHAEPGRRLARPDQPAYGLTLLVTDLSRVAGVLP